MSAVPTRALQRLALLAASTCAALLVAELGLRVFAALRDREAIENALREVAPPSDDPFAGLANIIRLSADERIVYELQPNLAARTYHGILVDTDSRGFRGPETEPARANTLTVVGLGDSILFGHGVAQDEAYLRVLDGLLSQAYPQAHWRVVNTGVPGYNTVMQVATLRAKALELEPDLVVLHICDNDFGTPAFVRRASDAWALDRSFVLDILRRGFGAGAGSAPPGPEAVIQGGRAWTRSGPGGERQPLDRYEHLVGAEAFRRALLELLELAHTHDFELLLFTTYEVRDIFPMLAIAREVGIESISMMDELEAWFQEHRGQPFSEALYKHSPLVVSPQNEHPSPLHHRMAAKRFLHELEQRGILERLLRRRGRAGPAAADGD